MAILYTVINERGQYLDWDDRGAMATGYPIWVELSHARQYNTFARAANAAESVKRFHKTAVWVQTIELEPVGEAIEILLPEEDPEWAEYERLKTKFGK